MICCSKREPIDCHVANNTGPPPSHLGSPHTPSFQPCLAAALPTTHIPSKTPQSHTEEEAKRRWLWVSKTPPLPGYSLETASRVTGRTPARGVTLRYAEEITTPLLPVLKIHQERLTNPCQHLGAPLKLEAIWVGDLFGFGVFVCLFPPSPHQASELPTSTHIQFCAPSVRIGMDSTFKHRSWGLNRGAVFRFRLGSANQDPGNQKQNKKLLISKEHKKKTSNNSKIHVARASSA